MATPNDSGANVNHALKIPDGRCVGDVDVDELRREFSRLQIPGYDPQMGLPVVISCYSQFLEAIARGAAHKAVADWLSDNKAG